MTDVAQERKVGGFTMTKGDKDMTERVLAELPNPSGKWRFVIIQRPDGNYTFRMQMAEGDKWGPSGLDAGVYDSAETAENEARAKLALNTFPDTLVWMPESAPHDGKAS